MAAFVFINDSDIQIGSVSGGTFYYEVTAADGSSFDEFSLRIDGGLPTHKYSVGETWKVEGKFEFTIDSVFAHTVCDDGYEESSSGLENSSPVIIVYSYKNLGSSELLIDKYDFTVYDANGTEGDALYFPIYCDHNVEAKGCISGGSATAKLPVALVNEGDSITIQMDVDGYDAIFEVLIGECVHVEADDEAIEPTCESVGITAGKHCTVCNKITVEQEEIAALGHKYVNDICTNCGEPDKTSDFYKYSTLKKKSDAIVFSCAETVIRGQLKNPSSMKVLKQEILDTDEFFRYYVKIQYSASNSLGGTVTDYAFLLIRVLPIMDGTFKYSYDTSLGMDMMLFDDDKANFGWGTQPDDWSLDSIDKFENPEEVSLKQIIAFPENYVGKYVKVNLVLRKNDIADREIYAYNSKDGSWDSSINIYVKYRLCDNMEELVMVDADYQQITVCGYVKMYSNDPTPYIEAYEITINE